MTAGVVLWDFDGTLAFRPGLWSACVLEVLDEQEPRHLGSVQVIRDALKDGFPWNRHHEPHPDLADPEAWWSALLPRIARAIGGCGVGDLRAGELARAVRTRFVDGTRGWSVYGDAPRALQATARGGWSNVIVSNHVPELPQLVDALGLGGLVDRVFSSALTGYEKPHPQAYLHALRECGRPAARWMVGNNPLADVAGAEAVGIPAILVRSTRDGMRSAPDLATAAAIVLAGGVEPDPDALTGYGHVSPGPLRLTGSAVAGRPTRR